MNILLIEDDPLTAYQFTELVEYLGHHITSILEYGEHVFYEIQTRSPDLILLDIRLAGKMDEIQVVDIIGNTLKIPIVFLTAFPEEFPRAVQSRGHQFLLKDCTAHDVKIAIAWALKQHRSQQTAADMTQMVQQRTQEMEQKNRALMRLHAKYEVLLDTVTSMLTYLDDISLNEAMDRFEQFYMLKALYYHDFDVKLAAESLKIGLSTFYTKCKKYGIALGGGVRVSNSF